MENKTNNERLDWLESPLSERDLEMAAYLFKYIEKYGLEATKAEIAFERAKRNLLVAADAGSYEAFLRAQEKLPVYLTAKDICEMLKISRSTIYYQMENGGFPIPLKFGNTVRWLYVDVMKWMSDQMPRYGF